MEELITDVNEIVVASVIVGGELFTDYSDHPRKLVTLNLQSSNQQARTPGFFPVGGITTMTAWPERLLSEKSGRCMALRRLRA